MTLTGKRILLTRPREQAERTAELLREQGAVPVVMPVIEIIPAAGLKPAVGYDYVVFTSENGARIACEQLKGFGKARIGVIGPGTARALEPFGLKADIVAEEHKGEGLAEAMLKEKPGRVLLLRAKEAREVLPETLRSHGWDVDVVTAYETRRASDEQVRAIIAALESASIDAITFTSASTVTSLCDALGDRAAQLLSLVKVVSIGPITTVAATSRGVRVDAEASPSTLPALIEALGAAFEPPAPIH